MMGTNRFDFEKVMIQVQEELTELQINQASVSERVDQLQTAIKKLKANIGVYRYNAFAEQQGNDLSFSIAIIDEYQSGLILTGLHSREESYIYAKPLDQGKSRYALSPEEKKAITLAVKTV